MFRHIIFSILLLLPTASWADSAAVLPVSYKIYRTASQSANRAAKVTDAAVSAVEKAGLTPVTGETAEAAAKKVSPAGNFSCIDEACLSAAAAEAGTDFAAAVTVVDSDGEFDIKVYVSGAETAAANHFGTFNAMLKRVRGMVESALKEAVEKKAAATKQPEPDPEVAPEPEPEPTVEPEPEPATDTAPPTPDASLNNRKKPISKAAFWSVFGVTLGLGAAYGAIEGIGYSKWQDIKDDPNRTADDESGVENFQLSSRILLGCLGAGVITTTVLAFFTDFKGTEHAAFAPVITDREAGFVLQGEF